VLDSYFLSVGPVFIFGGFSEGAGICTSFLT
jgi:hypothetical protein